MRARRLIDHVRRRRCRNKKTRQLVGFLMVFLRSRTTINYDLFLINSNSLPVKYNHYNYVCVVFFVLFVVFCFSTVAVYFRILFFCSENYACQALIFSGFALFFVKFLMWFISSERSNVGFFVLFCFSCFISLKSGKCFIDHCLPALFLQTLNPRFRAFVGVFFASPRTSLTLPIFLSPHFTVFRASILSLLISPKNAGAEVSFLAENEKNEKQ